MKRTALRAFTTASVMLWVITVAWALLAVWHLAHGQSGKFAGMFAMQAVVLAVVCTIGARVALVASRDLSDTA